MTLRYGMSFKVLNPNEFIPKPKSATLAHALPITEVREQAHRYLWIEHVEDDDVYVDGETQPNSSEQWSRTTVLMSHYCKTDT